MTKINEQPKHLPITDDRYNESDYKAVPHRVAEVNSHEPAQLRKVWNEVASDGYISQHDADKLNRTVGDVRLFGYKLHDGLDTAEARFLSARLQEGNVEMEPAVRKAYETELATRQARMEKGEVLSGTFQHGDSIHELTEGVVAMKFEDFMKLMPADKWGVNLAEYRGGEVKATTTDEQGRILTQRERMVLETPLSKLLPSVFEANDMTKVESIHYEPDRTVVKWEVLDSDNKTTLKDIGELRFIRMGDKTKIEFESEHRIDTFPGVLRLLEKVAPLDQPYKTMTSAVMRDFFSDCIRHYQDIAAQKEPSRL